MSGDKIRRLSVPPVETTVRTPRFVTRTPYHAAENVICWEDTYLLHIPIERRLIMPLDIAGKLTLADPSLVAEGTSNPSHLAYINLDLVSPNSNSPFVVFVDPAGQPMPAVASMGFRRDFRDIASLRVLMARKDGGDE